MEGGVPFLRLNFSLTIPAIKMEAKKKEVEISVLAADISDVIFRRIYL